MTFQIVIMILTLKLLFLPKVVSLLMANVKGDKIRTSQSAGAVSQFEVPMNTIVKRDEEVIFSCQGKDNKIVNWKRGKSFEQLNVGYKIFDKYFKTYEMIVDDTTRQKNLKINRATPTEAGFYYCAKLVSQIYGAHLIVVDNSIECDLKSNAKNDSMSEPIYLENNKQIKINCSINYYGDKSCQAVPLWYDLARNKKLTESNKNVNIGIGDGYLWLSINGTFKPENGTRYNLSLAFSCNFKNEDPKITYAENMPVLETEIVTPLFLFRGGIINYNSITSTSSSLTTTTAGSWVQSYGLILTVTAAAASLTVLGVSIVVAALIQKSKSCSLTQVVTSKSLKNDNYQSIETSNDQTIQYIGLENPEISGQNIASGETSDVYTNIDEAENIYDEISEYEHYLKLKL